MTGAAQLGLALGHRPAYSGEDFMVAPANQDAVRWLDAWPAWPSSALIVHGPPGCGKSHLARIFAARADGRVIDPAAPDPEPAAATLGGVWVIDDADGVADETAFLHLYNGVAAQGGNLLLTARRPARQWGLGLPDLESRLLAAQSVAIGAPDDPLIEAVLAKLFSDRQLLVEARVIGYLRRRMERSLGAARRLVAALDAAALASGRKVSLALARQVLGEIDQHQSDDQ